MTRIILVRHVQAQGNEQRFFQGAVDTEITAKGAKQIERLARLFENEKIDALYSSPLKRAVLTAQGVNRSHKLPIILRDDLKELDAGVWEGRSIAENAEKYPYDYDCLQNRLHLFCPDGSEGMGAVYVRVWNAIEDILKDNEGKSVCIVSHGFAIRNILCHAHGLPLERLMDVPRGENAAVSRLEFSGDSLPRILEENGIKHLEGLN